MCIRDRGKSPLQESDVYLNNFLIFSRHFYDLIPSVRNDSKSMNWCYDGERDLERELCVDREIELYKLKRDYNELKEMLGVIEINDMKYLPVKIESENYFDDTCLNNNNNLTYDEKMTDLILNITTDGDWTEINNVDLVYDKIIIIGSNPMYDYCGKTNKLKFYGYYTQDGHMRYINKAENCYVKPRLIFDDGG